MKHHYLGKFPKFYQICHIRKNSYRRKSLKTKQLFFYYFFRIFCMKNYKDDVLLIITMLIGIFLMLSLYLMFNVTLYKLFF